MPCSTCRHWIRNLSDGRPLPDGQCRLNPPVPVVEINSEIDGSSGDMVLVNSIVTMVQAETHENFQCGQHELPSMQREAKVPTAQILEFVREGTQAMPPDEQNPQGIPECAMLRSDLAFDLINQRGMSKPAAYRRIQSLVDRGVLKLGKNPFPADHHGPEAVCVWLPKDGATEPEKLPPGRPQACTPELFLTLFRQFAGTIPRSLRKTHLAVEKTVPMSLATARGLMNQLIEQGKVVRNEAGYLPVPEEI